MSDAARELGLEPSDEHEVTPFELFFDLVMVTEPAWKSTAQPPNNQYLIRCRSSS